MVPFGPDPAGDEPAGGPGGKGTEMTTRREPPAGHAGPALMEMDLAGDARPTIGQASTYEWLETNGRGDFASSTVFLGATRRYHGLLVATPPGLEKRHLFLARYEETLHRPNRSFSLDAARYDGRWTAPGFGALVRFSLVPFPSFAYRLGRTEVRRDILMVEGTTRVLCRYRIESPREDISLRLRPLLACREADSLTHENLDLDPRVERKVDGIVCRPYSELPALRFRIAGAAPTFDADPLWYRGTEYQEELARGYEGREDLFTPGWFNLRVPPDGEIVIGVDIGHDAYDPAEAWAKASGERRKRSRRAMNSPGVRERLGVAADAYLATTPGGRTGVVAGYPWFLEWGRDTCISLPGLLLARGHLEACGEALEDLLPHLRGGLLPNIFGTSPATSHYGSVDAALWFARAVRLYEVAGGGEEQTLSIFRSGLEEIARRYRDGTGLGTHMDEGGLIASGDASTNATWMDARGAEGPVTPRDGCAVEINALWYSLLTHVERLAHAAGDRKGASRWRDLRRRAKRSFLARFWLEDAAYLADRWREGVPDPSVRPNMVIAAALEFSPLSKAQRAEVVRVARAELLTPFGLRTLSPKDPRYQARYEGDVESRDGAYHQGTVWPWLLGFYCEASVRAHGSKRVAHLRDLLLGFREHLDHAGLNQVSEVFDGDPPHRPGGAIAQAWSVAELLRAWHLVEEGRA